MERTRKPLRLSGYDYAAHGVYFITFCVQDMHPLLWETTRARNARPYDSAPADTTGSASVGARIARPQTGTTPPVPYDLDNLPLSAAGQVVQTAIDQIPTHYPNVSVVNAVVMPNHVHLLLRFGAGGGRAMRAPTVSRVINQLKGAVTKQLGYRIWQRSYYDHIVRDREDFAVRYNYILNNPRRWMEDEYFTP